MKTHRAYQPELIASQDVTRVNLTNVHLDMETKRLVATNGHMMVILPCTPEEHDTTGPIPADALKHARKSAKKMHADELSVMANGKVEAGYGPDMIAMARPEAGPFPPWQQVVPEYRHGDAGTVTVGLNAEYLLTLAKAIGALKGRDNKAVIKITVKIPERSADGSLDPIVVEGDDSEALGILMPCRV